MRARLATCAALALALHGCTSAAAPDDDADVSADVDAGDGGADDAAASPDRGAIPATCAVDSDCDDGRTCVTHRCDTDAGHCVWTQKPGTCLIDAVCVAPGASGAAGPCRVCDPARDPDDWSAAAEGAPCDDGDLCTRDDACTAGACVGAALDCGAATACAAPVCDPVLGCIALPLDGNACDDGDACTGGDRCRDGGCSGTPLLCDDGDACTVGESCQGEGACGGGAARSCDDENPCTIDTCDPVAGCAHLPRLTPCCAGGTSVCDDGDPCTVDLCDDTTGACGAAWSEAACDDGNACTIGDTCAEGVCGGAEASCDDGEPCTVDFCDPASGCAVQRLDGGTCDDGLACTSGDRCVDGVCTARTSDCFCTPTFGRHAVKLTALAIGDGGRVGQALDLDLNPETCAPRGSCADGRDNALSVVGSFANTPLADAIAAGTLVLLLDLSDVDARPFTIAVHQGRLAPDDSGCNVQTEPCSYEVQRAGLDPATCAPVVQLGATLTDDTIRAGGPGTVFPLTLPIGAASLTLTLYDVRLDATLTRRDDDVVGLSGVLGGAVSKAALRDALLALPPGALPLDPTAVASLLDRLVTNDIDTDGDGTPDAASIGLRVEGIGATLTRVVTP